MTKDELPLLDSVPAAVDLAGGRDEPSHSRIIGTYVPELHQPVSSNTDA